MKVSNSARGVEIHGYNPVTLGTSIRRPNYSPDNFLFWRNTDGSRLSYVCDDAGTCSPVDVFSPSKTSPEKGPSSRVDNGSQSCQSLYKIYKQCYKAGIGETSKNCASLSANLYQGLNTGDKDFEASVSLFCGLACNEAAQLKKISPYSNFNSQYCK